MYTFFLIFQMLYVYKQNYKPTRYRARIAASSLNAKLG